MAEYGKNMAEAAMDGSGQMWAEIANQQSTLPDAGRSLFEDKVLPSVSEAMEWDRETWGFELGSEAKRMATYGRIRLVNYIRKNHPTPAQVAQLTGKEAEIFASDEYLKPVLVDEDDPMLLQQEDPAKRIASLERKLAAAKQDLVDYRAPVSTQLDLVGLWAAVDEPGPLPQSKRDDDSHYFDSYGENDIHGVMLQDKVRTALYASFILSNPALFTNATVLDVGCGTGILSLFAARAGAKHVYAVDASSGIVHRARRIVEANGLQDVITVLEGKVEDVVLPDGTDRVEFWDDLTDDHVGFDLSVMKESVWADAIVDVVGPETLLSDAVCVEDLHLASITPAQLSFSSPFTLLSTSDRRRKVTAFVLYFDMFFVPTAGQTQTEAEMEVKVVREDDALLAEVWPLGAGVGRMPQRKPSVKVAAAVVGGEATDNGQEKAKEPPLAITSFSTGPQSEPIVTDSSTSISGHFHCTKSSTNARELDVEIHYSVGGAGSGAEGTQGTVVQMYKVR
ncbi:S-adenosyl-L-methionine-dependent methyltransferase [Mycena amicta]|nr:S-adenosyl-L-methionine-dependent methyltransferase [Mycena amicta]